MNILTTILLFVFLTVVAVLLAAVASRPKQIHYHQHPAPSARLYSSGGLAPRGSVTIRDVDGLTPEEAAEVQRRLSEFLRKTGDDDGATGAKS